MNTIDEVSGSETDRAAIWIQKMIQKTPGVTPSTMKRMLLSTSNDATPLISSESTFNRALARLSKEKKIVKVKEPDKKAAHYYLPNQKKEVLQTGGPNELESLLVNECKRLVSDMIADRFLLDPSLSPRFAATSFKYSPSAEENRRLNLRCSSLYNLVMEWETRRGISVPRPWKISTPDFLLGDAFGFDEDEDTDPTPPPALPDNADEEARMKYNRQMKEYDCEFYSPIRERRREIKESGVIPFPAIRDWFKFYVNVIEAASTLANGAEVVKKPKARKKRKKSKKKDDQRRTES